MFKSLPCFGIYQIEMFAKKFLLNTIRRETGLPRPGYQPHSHCCLCFCCTAIRIVSQWSFGRKYLAPSVQKLLSVLLLNSTFRIEIIAKEQKRFFCHVLFVTNICSTVENNSIRHVASNVFFFFLRTYYRLLIYRKARKNRWYTFFYLFNNCNRSKNRLRTFSSKFYILTY